MCNFKRDSLLRWFWDGDHDLIVHFVIRLQLRTVSLLRTGQEGLGLRCSWERSGGVGRGGRRGGGRGWGGEVWEVVKLLAPPPAAAALTGTVGAIQWVRIAVAACHSPTPTPWLTVDLVLVSFVLCKSNLNTKFSRIKNLLLKYAASKWQCGSAHLGIL